MKNVLAKLSFILATSGCATSLPENKAVFPSPSGDVYTEAQNCNDNLRQVLQQAEVNKSDTCLDTYKFVLDLSRTVGSCHTTYSSLQKGEPVFIFSTKVELDTFEKEIFYINELYAAYIENVTSICLTPEDRKFFNGIALSYNSQQ